MRAVFGLMVMMLGASHGVKTSCDGKQNRNECYGVLRGTVNLQLMDHTSEILRYQLKKESTIIMKGRGNRLMTDLPDKRFSFTPNDGTFRIRTLRMRDAGEYTLEIFDSNGEQTVRQTLELIIQGVETSCDARKNRAKCYGALEGTVNLQLMDDASKIHKYLWRKNSTNILNGRGDRLVTDLSESRFSFSPNDGTFRIDNLRRQDGGEYTLQIFDSSGAETVTQTLQLIIQAPVSSVQLVSECLSQGEMRVSCSSGEGDSPQYNWTLNGQNLQGSQLYSGNHETQNITLKQDVSGPLVCTVRNQVSRVEEQKTISTCGFKLFDCTLTNGTYIKQWLRPTNETLCIESTTTPEDPSLIVCSLKAAVILIIIGIFLYFAWKKNKLKKAEGSADREEVEYENTSVVMVEMRSSAAEP